MREDEMRAEERLVIGLANNEWEDLRRSGKAPALRLIERKWKIKAGRLIYWRANRKRIGDL